MPVIKRIGKRRIILLRLECESADAVRGKALCRMSTCGDSDIRSRASATAGPRNHAKILRSTEELALRRRDALERPESPESIGLRARAPLTDLTIQIATRRAG